MDNEEVIIAFDVDNTLITEKFEPIYTNIWLLINLSTIKNVKILVWSGGGREYAQHHIEKLGLKNYVKYISDKNRIMADHYQPQITFDDQIINLGKVNLQVS
jgi:phosphoserine phosphatase